MYHNHSLKKAQNYPVDTIRPPRLLRRAPRKGSNGGVDTERRSGGQKRKGDHYRKDEREVFHPRQEETKWNTARYLGIATPVLQSWEPPRGFIIIIIIIISSNMHRMIPVISPMPPELPPRKGHRGPYEKAMGGSKRGQER